jgi:hypothetical protein
LKRTLEGLFAFCIFHPNQADNLTEAFQIVFVLPFLIATLALLAAAFFARLRRKWVATFGLASAPVLAAWNMAGGLMIGPAVLLVGIAKRFPWRVMVIVFSIFAVSAGTYFWGFKPPDPSHPPQAALADPKGIFVYMLTYFGASWTRMLPHKERTIAFLFLVALLALCIRAVRSRRVSDFKWFCFSECFLMISVAFVTALGRLRFGPGQAFESRYQTPAMLYWGGFGALVLITIWKSRPSRFRLAQAGIALILLVSMLTFGRIWRVASVRADSFRSVCNTITYGKVDEQAIKELYAGDAGIEPGASFLRKLWSGEPSDPESKKGLLVVQNSSPEPYLLSSRHLNSKKIKKMPVFLRFALYKRARSPVLSRCPRRALNILTAFCLILDLWQTTVMQSSL